MEVIDIGGHRWSKSKETVNIIQINPVVLQVFSWTLKFLHERFISGGAFAILFTYLINQTFTGALCS